MRLLNIPKRLFAQKAFLDKACLFSIYFLLTPHPVMAVPKLKEQTESIPSEQLPFPKQKLEMEIVKNKPYLTWAIKRDFNVDVMSSSTSGKLVYVCEYPNPDKNQDPNEGVCLLDPQTGIEWQIVAPLPAAVLGIVKLEGDWVVYAINKKPQRFFAIHLKTGKKLEIGKIETQRVINQLGPTFAVSEGRVFWGNEKEKDGVQFGELHQYDLEKGTDQILYTLPLKNTFVTISASKARVVFSMEEAWGEMRSVILNLKTKKTKYLTETMTSGAKIWNDTIIWKGDDQFRYGNIWMCTLTADDECNPQPIEMQKQHDFPTIGSYGMTWITFRSYKAFLFDPKKKQKELIDDNAVRQAIVGKYMTWIQHGSSLELDSPTWMYITDLSAKTPKTVQKK